MFAALGHLLYLGHLHSLPLKENLKLLKVQGPVWLWLWLSGKANNAECWYVRSSCCIFELKISGKVSWYGNWAKWFDMASRHLDRWHLFLRCSRSHHPGHHHHHHHHHHQHHHHHHHHEAPAPTTLAKHYLFFGHWSEIIKIFNVFPKRFCSQIHQQQQQKFSISTFSCKLESSSLLCWEVIIIINIIIMNIIIMNIITMNIIIINSICISIITFSCKLERSSLLCWEVIEATTALSEKGHHHRNCCFDKDSRLE